MNSLKRLFPILLSVLIITAALFVGTDVFAAEDGTTGYTYGQYDMTYLPGTTDTVTNMPENETGLTPGANSPYTVTSTVPQREGFEFIDWTLTWGTMERPIPLAYYVVKYLDIADDEPVAPEKTVEGILVGTAVTESAIVVSGYRFIGDNEEQTLEIAESGNEIIFYYAKIDYSDAITVIKKATAAAAGDANTARAYTITLEAKVNINADDPTGLFVENLTVTDTIEDEFVLNSARAEILDAAGNASEASGSVDTVVNSDGTTTVTYDFGNVEHGYTARLILEVTAQTDYIGSNGVYTNVGESGWTYKHTDPEATAAEKYSATCADKPQVNVPIRSFIVTQGTATQRMGLLLTVFGTVDWIPTYPYSGEWNDFLVHSESDALLFTKYDQINGTVTHDKWIDPDKYPYDLNRAIHVAGGVPEDDVLYSPRNNWRVPTNHPLGDFPVYLYVTFTPDEVTDGEFADATTAEPVGARTEVGVGLVTIIPRQAEIEIIE